MQQTWVRRVLAVGAATTLLGGLASLPVAAAPGDPPDPQHAGPEAVEAPEWVTDQKIDRSMLRIPQRRRGFGIQQEGDGYEEGDTRLALVLDTTKQPRYSIEPFVVREIGKHIEVWVQKDLSFPEGDARNPVRVTDAQIQYLVNEFDTTIYPRTSEFWRKPDQLTGRKARLDDSLGLPSNYYVPADGESRVIAMVMNVRDRNYYGNADQYIAGFFSPTFEFYFNRNIITIDSYDWANRVGQPADAPWSDGNPANNRPHLYDGTFAHEYQHLLHSDQDADESTWVNEGLADWTEKLVGYGLPDSHLTAAQRKPENSLVRWQDQGFSELLADYGLSAMFMDYLYDRYGKSVLQALFDSSANGFPGVNQALEKIGADATFAELYHEYALARLIDGKAVGPTKGYYGLAATNTPLALFTAGGAPNPEAFATAGAPPWGSDYRVISRDSAETLRFDGKDQLTRPTPWSVVPDPLGSGHGEVLASGHTDASDRWLIMRAQGGGTLSFDTLYNIEKGWGLGALQVSTDGGKTWQSQSYALTVDDPSGMNPNAVTRVLEQLPGVTGWSETWREVSVDLSQYSGDILVAFRYVTDPAAAGNGVGVDPGWYVDNITVNGQRVSDGSSTEPFLGITEVNPVDLDFHVDVVGVNPQGASGKAQHKVFSLRLDDDTESSGVFDLGKVLTEDGYAVAVVTYDAASGQGTYAPYQLVVEREGDDDGGDEEADGDD